MLLLNEDGGHGLLNGAYLVSRENESGRRSDAFMSRSGKALQERALPIDAMTLKQSTYLIRHYRFDIIIIIFFPFPFPFPFLFPFSIPFPFSSSPLTPPLPLDKLESSPEEKFPLKHANIFTKSHKGFLGRCINILGRSSKLCELLLLLLLLFCFVL